MTERETITTAEAAELLGVSQTAIKARLKRGTLDGEQARPGAPWRVYRDALPARAVEAVLRDQQVEAEHLLELEALRQQVEAERQAERQQHAAERETQAERIGHLTGQVEAMRAELENLRPLPERLASAVDAVAALETRHREQVAQLLADHRAEIARIQAALPAPADQQPTTGQAAASGDALDAAGRELQLVALRARLEALEASQGGLGAILRRMLGR